MGHSARTIIVSAADERPTSLPLIPIITPTLELTVYERLGKCRDHVLRPAILQGEVAVGSSPL
jgi:hypothetical protein